MLGIQPKFQTCEKQKNRENKTPKKNNHMHKTVFTWFGNLPTSTELQGFHYYKRKFRFVLKIKKNETWGLFGLNLLFLKLKTENTVAK